ncbi:hypothetical protein DNU06_04485 [Putridiphycobacter roseus]|uniref:Leucine-rich repeat domain-containing protein n=1 Tax=Putridiphycobacter roseus TaxID=2219161 RepID=A0A2W1N488_9FLAO|nr:hypothetical protein [Putridiphycobacter roseus]PZE17881.1 hypothetical protein DNU06_04485 [Putridiphycobacter roseus]
MRNFYRYRSLINIKLKVLYIFLLCCVTGYSQCHYVRSFYRSYYHYTKYGDPEFYSTPGYGSFKSGGAVTFEGIYRNIDRLNYIKEDLDLIIKLDNASVNFFNNYKGKLSITDLKNIRSVQVVCDFSHGKTYKKIASEFFNDWISDLSKMNHDVEIIIPSHFQIAKIDGLKKLTVYVEDSLNPAIYLNEEIEIFEVNFIKKRWPSSSINDRCFQKNLNLKPFNQLKTFKIRCHGVYTDSVVFKNLCASPQLESFVLDAPNLLFFNFEILRDFHKIKSCTIKSKAFHNSHVPLLSHHELMCLKIESQEIVQFDFNDLIESKKLKYCKLRLDSAEHISPPKVRYDSLSELEIYSNNLDSLELGSAYFPHLHEVYLVTPSLSYICPEFFNLNTLRYLGIVESNLSEIPSGLKNLYSLEILYLVLPKLKWNSSIFNDYINICEVRFSETASSEKYYTYPDTKVKKDRKNIIKTIKLRKSIPVEVKSMEVRTNLF